MNTLIRVLYKDNLGFETRTELVFEGAITKEQYFVIGECLFEKSRCIMSQMGLPSPSDQFIDLEDFPDPEVDHPFSILEDWLVPTKPIALLTSRSPTEQISIAEFVQNLRKIDCWDVEKGKISLFRKKILYRESKRILEESITNV